MDLKTYFQLFWVPSIASVVLIGLLSAQRRLSGRTPLFVVWFLIAFAAQYFAAPASASWVAGLVLQTALALYLLFKHQLSQL